MKKSLLTALIALILTGCGNNEPNTAHQDSGAGTPNAQTTEQSSEKIDEETAKLLETLQPSENDPTCKIPKADYKYISCFWPRDEAKTIFIATTDDDNGSPIKQDLIDIKGQVIANLLDYDGIDYSIGGGLIAVNKDDKVGYINTKGELVIPMMYELDIDPDNKYDETWANTANEFGIIVKKGGKYGAINHKNETIVPFEYCNLTSFDEFGVGLYFSCTNTKDEYDQYSMTEWGIIDYKGNKINLADKYAGTIGNFSGYDGFSEGLLAVVDKNDKFGFIDKKGEVVIAPEYDDIRSFSEGVAGATKNGKWGFIDKNNKPVIDFQYSDENVPRYSVNYMGAFMFVFNGGIAQVSTDVKDEIMCIDKNNNRVQDAIQCPNGQ